MAKKDIKKILKDLPSGQPKKVAGNVVARIIKREVERWREKRFSWGLLGLLGILGALGIVKVLEAVEILDTADFWAIVSLDRSFLDWQSFLEGNPVTEGLFVIIISLLLIVPIWVLRHKDKEIGR